MAQPPPGLTHLPVANPEGSVGQDVDIWALLGTPPVPMMVHELGEGAAARFINPSFTAAFGYTLVDAPSVAAWAERAYPDPDYRREVMARWWDEITTRQVTSTVAPPGEYRIIDKAGRPRDVLIGFALQRDLVIVTFQDLTPTRVAEAALEASRAFTWNIDLRTRMLKLDEYWAVAHEYRYSTEGVDMTVAAWFETLHPEDAQAVTAGLEALRQGASDKRSAVYRCRDREDGCWNWMQVHAGVRERDSEGIPTALSGVSFDITAEMTARARAQEEQAQLREDLQRAQQRDTVAQVAGGVAHDLNNLIAVVAGTVELLELQAAGQAGLLSGLGRIRRSVDMARDLIAGLGGLVRPELPREAQDLGKLLRNAVDLLGQRRIEQHNTRVELSEAGPPVWANPTEVAQVIVNLAINACDAGAPERPAMVTLATLPPGTSPPSRAPDAGFLPPAGVPMALFSITDTGAGITDDVRARMFRPNFTTKGKAGTGLGLLIVSTILQTNRAALWVDSTLGRGTTITVAWPAAVPADAGQGARKATTQRAAVAPAELLRDLHVLVVDDLVDVAEVLADMLEAAGAVAVAISPEFNTSR